MTYNYTPAKCVGHDIITPTEPEYELFITPFPVPVIASIFTHQ